jgi:hypothetical protein
MSMTKGAKVIRTQGGGTLIKPAPPPTTTLKPERTSKMARAKTFQEVLNEPARHEPTLSPADLDRFMALLTRKAEDTTPTPKSATDEVEDRIAAKISANPVTITRAMAAHEVFTADPALYERYRAENTVGTDGQVLDRNPSKHNVGTGRVTAKSDVDAEVTRRVNELVAKTAGATMEQALAFLAREQPELMARWQRESYA